MLIALLKMLATYLAKLFALYKNASTQSMFFVYVLEIAQNNSKRDLIYTT